MKTLLILTGPQGSLRAAQGYLKYHYDANYHTTTYNLFKKEISERLPKEKTITINFFPDCNNFCKEQHLLNFNKLQETHPGLINHFLCQGNDIVFQSIKKYIIDHHDTV
jgi:hypothetical protein